jgi:hypothetical protein
MADFILFLAEIIRRNFILLFSAGHLHLRCAASETAHYHEAERRLIEQVSDVGEELAGHVAAGQNVEQRLFRQRCCDSSRSRSGRPPRASA